MFEAWGRGKGAVLESGTSPAWDFPSTLPDLPSISFLRGSDIAQSAPVSLYSWGPSAVSRDVTLPGLGTTVGMSEAAQSPCGLIAATLSGPGPWKK